MAVRWEVGAKRKWIQEKKQDGRNYEFWTYPSPLPLSPSLPLAHLALRGQRKKTIKHVKGVVHHPMGLFKGGPSPHVSLDRPVLTSFGYKSFHCLFLRSFCSWCPFLLGKLEDTFVEPLSALRAAVTNIGTSSPIKPSKELPGIRYLRIKDHCFPGALSSVTTRVTTVSPPSVPLVPRSTAFFDGVRAGPGRVGSEDRILDRQDRPTGPV